LLPQVAHTSSVRIEPDEWVASKGFKAISDPWQV
jgi:hypothetical protein